MPYTLAIHAGRDAAGQSHNPHAHLMFSERQNDGLARSPETWFKRANGQEPERGGASKSRTFHGPAWVEQARARWAARTNEALARAGSATRVDHRSYARQGINREPGRHLGPAGPRVYARGQGSDRLEDALAVADEAHAMRALDQAIAQLEVARAAAAREATHDEREVGPRGADRDDGSGRGR